jgi:phage baseplate assembly protein W
MQLNSFKNVGIKEGETYQVYQVEQSLQPIGIKTPVSLASNDNTLFEMHYVLGDQIQDNLRNLVQTNFGERLGRYNYGANLKPLMTEYYNKTDFENEAMVRIKTAVTKWLPFVQLEGFGSSAIYEDNLYTGKISIIIQYSVPQLNINARTMEVLLFTT